MMTLAGKEIILGVTGSIAAYKAGYLLRELVRLGAGVNVVLTQHAQKFVGPLTFRTLSGRPVLTDLFDPQTDAAVEHVELASRCHALIAAPATAGAHRRHARGPGPHGPRAGRRRAGLEARGQGAPPRDRRDPRNTPAPPLSAPRPGRPAASVSGGGQPAAHRSPA